LNKKREKETEKRQPLLNRLKSLRSLSILISIFLTILPPSNLKFFYHSEIELFYFSLKNVCKGINWNNRILDCGFPTKLILPNLSGKKKVDYSLSNE